MSGERGEIRPVVRVLGGLLFRWPWLALAAVVAVTAAFATQLPGVRMFSDFADLLPQDHPYIQLHNRVRDTFGGANVIVVSLEVAEGTIFQDEHLRRLDRLTIAIDDLPGVNHNLVSSLTHRTARRIWLAEDGAMMSQPYFDRGSEEFDAAELEQLKRWVQSDPQVYGLLVSPDLKAALIRAQLTETGLDYKETFRKLQEVREDEAAPGIAIHATGQPVLIGWTYFYLPEIFQIFAFTVLIMLGLLIYYFRRLYGIFLPLLSTVLSALWGLGFLALCGYNIDPLTLVVPFLVSARTLSHSVQMVERYYEELARLREQRRAARSAFDHLFLPGLLGILSDAAGIWLISLSAIPLNVKMATYCSFWAASIIVTVLFVVPLMLTVLPQPRRTALGHHGLRRVLPGLAAAVTSPRGGRAVLIGSAVCIVFGSYLSSWIEIGESEPGSPIMFRDHDYNRSSAAINGAFPGSEELYVIARSEEAGGLKRPEVLRALGDFQNFMLEDPELGGTRGLPDLVARMNRLTRNDDPRWAQIPGESAYVGGLLFTYLATSPTPNATKEYVNPGETEANVVFYLKDHQGATIRRTIDRVEAWMESPAADVEGLHLDLAGGLIGVTAAINEEVYLGNNRVILAVLSFVFVAVLLFYRSVHAGVLMLATMSFATVLVHAFMGVKGIGININTVPVVAIGIGVGIDYAIYIMDRIREEAPRFGDLSRAAREAICTTGLAISFTATTLVTGVVLWIFMSSLRFQADSATLLVLMMIVNMLAAMIFVPAWVVVLRPRFLLVEAERAVAAGQPGDAEPRPTSPEPGDYSLGEPAARKLSTES